MFSNGVNMSTDLIIVSGFLGSGKTTLIQNYLLEKYKDKKVVIIENDFGAVSVDATLLRSGGIEVKELISGCICCSLAGDFIAALTDVLDCFQPDVILIEPSGVSKLSDIITACSSPLLVQRIRIKAKITVVDGNRCSQFLSRFGEFYHDQIENADAILISHLEGMTDELETVTETLRNLNPSTPILCLPLDQMQMDLILDASDSIPITSDLHDHHKHEGEGEEEHEHDAQEIFDEFTIQSDRLFCAADLVTRFGRLKQDAYGTILRAKGIVPATDGYLNIQYIPDDVQITPCSTFGTAITFIGRNLNRESLAALFGVSE
jgi:G3E family GTPase